MFAKIIESLRYPILTILLEIAAIASATILGLKEAYEELAHHTIVILIIATFGWVLTSIVRAVFLHTVARYEKEYPEVSQRGMVTQFHLLYRLAMFFIVVVTIAGILLTFPLIKTVGIGILGSAGIVGLALGIAARPILLNLMAGLQIAMTKTIKIGDAILIENEWCRVESIYLTHVVANTWDWRRMILPISYFIDRPFQNWDIKSTELFGSIFLYCDYQVPVDALRKKFYELLEDAPNWNRKAAGFHVTDCSEKTIQIRLAMSARDASSAFDLKCYIRENMIQYLAKEYPWALPCVRNRIEDEQAVDTGRTK